MMMKKQNMIGGGFVNAELDSARLETAGFGKRLSHKNQLPFDIPPQYSLTHSLLLLTRIIFSWPRQVSRTSTLVIIIAK